MAQSWDSRRLQHQREYEDRFTADMRRLAIDIGEVVKRFASPPPDKKNAPRSEWLIPDRRETRDRLKAAIWTGVIRPYLGEKDRALDGIRPRSPYARLIVEGIEGAIRIQMERQIALIEQYAKRDPVVWAWLTGSRPARVAEQGDRRLGYDPFHLFVYGDSPYTLSDRVWQTAQTTRDMIDRLLDYEIPKGTAAVELADMLVPFLSGQKGQAQWLTKKPYGTVGSYSARRLARTEITAAAGRSAINASIANPFIEYLRWRLSTSHPRFDICDLLAYGGPRGDGTYDPRDFPAYPAHPHCLCSVVPVVVKNPSAVVIELRQQIDARTPEAMNLRGAFNLEWIIGAMMTGLFIKEVLEETG